MKLCLRTFLIAFLWFPLAAAQAGNASVSLLHGTYNAYGRVMTCDITGDGQVTITDTQNGFTTTQTKSLSYTPQAMSDLNKQLDLLIAGPYIYGGMDNVNYVNPWGTISAKGKTIMESGTGWWGQSEPHGDNSDITPIYQMMTGICGFEM